MQGLPIQQLSKSTKGTGKVQGTVDSKASSKDESGVNIDGAKTEEVKGDFSSLFASLTGKSTENKSSGKSSEVKSETGETLKNLLAVKNADKLADGKNSEVKTEAAVNVDPKLIFEGLDVQPKVEETKEEKGGKPSQEQIGPAIAKTSNGLDLLLNNLKGTQDSVDGDESEKIKNPDQTIKGFRTGNEDSLEEESKIESENPLEFLMKGMKTKNVGENVEFSSEKKSESVTPKVVTAEDYLKNIESTSDKKNSSKLVLLNATGDVEKNPIAQKMFNTNVKSYGQGQNLLNDTMIRKTKDLSIKETKKVKSDVSGISEILSKDATAGAELSNIKQDVVPALQGKNNQEQSQMQASTNHKVLDLSKIDSTNTTEIIKKISDYVEQNQVANKSSLDLTVKHESLGEFKIQVSKMPESMNRGLSQIDMQITTSSKEGHEFFVKNEVSLMRNLNQAGINLSDLRIISSMGESTAFGQSDSRQSSSFGQNPDGSSKQSMNFESSNFAGSGSEGSQRRKELWEEYQQRYGA